MSVMRDLTGQRYGKLTVLRIAEPYIARRGKGIRKIHRWVCRCDCGRESVARGDALRISKTTSCGRCRVPKFKDLTGQRFGRWLVLNRVYRCNTRVQWACRCDCGADGVVTSRALTHRESLSCGCYKGDVTAKRNTSHGMSYTATYRSWQSMIARCTYSCVAHWRHYGGRGIMVCERWRESFEDFLEDMGERPPGTSIDRIDVNGNYEPANCRWATCVEQGRNTRRSRVSLDIANEVLGRFEHGEDPASIAARIGVCKSTVRNVITGKVWRELERQWPAGTFPR